MKNALKTFLLTPPFFNSIVHYSLLLVAITDNVRTDENPHPGHFLPFGHPKAGTRIPVEERRGFLPPSVFFSDFLVPRRPLIFRGGFNETRAFKLWEDDYFRSLKDLMSTTMTVETAQKESRDQEVLSVPFNIILDIYKEVPLYVVTNTPAQLRKDIPLPGAIQCPEFFPFLAANLFWMSRGGTVGLVHIDHQDNINCVVRGEKNTIIVDPMKFPYVPLDKSNGSYSTINVDAVDYTKYPTMSSVTEYFFANVSAGDCLYIPANFIHQVRSFERNIAVNFFWSSDAANQVDISAVHSTAADIDWEEERLPNLRDHVRRLLREFSPLTLKRFWFHQMTDIYSDTYAFKNKPATFEERALAIFRDGVFQGLYVDADGEIEKEDLDRLKDEDWDEVQKSFDEMEEVVIQAEEWEIRKKREL